MSDVIWALDQRERCIACPSKPVANAVVLYLAESGEIGRLAAGDLAEGGVMAASVAWPGATSELSEDDFLDLDDAVNGLRSLAQAVAVVGEGQAREVAQDVAQRVGDVAYVGSDPDVALERLTAIAPA